jgi:hypothetical protein
MPKDTHLIEHPSGYMWGAALRAAARSRFKFSLPCESSLKDRLRAGLETHHVGLSEFAERKTEAQHSVEKLVRAMVNAQLAKDPAADILDEWTIAQVLDDQNLCPGLWPIC